LKQQPRQEVIDYTALDDELIAKAKDIFNKSYQVGRTVRLIGVRFSQLIPFTMQMSLFDNKVEKLQLYKAVDDIKDRFGSKMVTKAVNSGSKEDPILILQSIIKRNSPVIKVNCFKYCSL
jgi:DNA polymerase-4